MDYEAISVTDSAVGFTASKLSPSGAAPPQHVFFTVETASCRFRIDGTAPTSTEGHPLLVGDRVNIVGLQSLHNFRAIRDTVTSATLRVTYLAEGCGVTVRR